MSGWIKLHRKIQEHWLFNFDEPDKALAFIDLVLSASYQDKKVVIKGKVYQLKKGQLLLSQVSLQKRWKWSQNKVARFLKLLKSERMIDIETDERTSVISVCNYSDYQDSERTDEQPSERTDEQPAERGTNDQANDNIRKKQLKEGKKGNKKESDLNFESWPCMPSQQIFNDWVNVRKAKRLAITQTAIDLIGKELHIAVSAGWSVDDALGLAVARGCGGFEASWLKGSPNGLPQKGATRENLIHGYQEFLNEY